MAAIILIIDNLMEFVFTVGRPSSTEPKVQEEKQRNSDRDSRDL